MLQSKRLERTVRLGPREIFLSLGVLLSLPSFLCAQAQSSEATQTQIRKIVERIFDQNVKLGTSTIAPGVQAYTRVPLSESEIAEISSFGEDAIPILAEYLKSPRIRFRELAIRCLGYMGGTEPSKLLEETVLVSESQGLRLQALEWVGSFPGFAAASSLRKIEKNSSDQLIRARAKDLLVARGRGIIFKTN